MLSYSIASQHVMEPEGSIPNSQELSACSYPEPDQSSPHHPIPPLYFRLIGRVAPNEKGRWLQEVSSRWFGRRRSWHIPRWKWPEGSRNPQRGWQCPSWVAPVYKVRPLPLRHCSLAQLRAASKYSTARTGATTSSTRLLTGILDILQHPKWKCESRHGILPALIMFPSPWTPSCLTS
jgi:hypothetical protein